jgi:hypothetical protein
MVTGSRTICIVTSFGLDHSGADADEKHTLLSVLRAELSNCSVHGRFADNICRRQRHIELSHGLQVCRAAGDGDNFLDLALENQWHEEVKQMDVSDDVDSE